MNGSIKLIIAIFTSGVIGLAVGYGARGEAVKNNKETITRHELILENHSKRFGDIESKMNDNQIAILEKLNEIEKKLPR